MKFAAFIFILGSFIGWLMEIGFKFFSGQDLGKAGMSKGPFCALYGIGATILYLVIYRNISNVILIFLSSAFFLTFIEFLAGFTLDKVFKLTLWDYSDKKMSINKYICGEFMILWGVLGVVFVKFAIPLFQRVFTGIDNDIGLVSILLLLLIIGVDYLVSTIIRINSLVNNRVKV